MKQKTELEKLWEQVSAAKILLIHWRDVFFKLGDYKLSDLENPVFAYENKGWTAHREWHNLQVNYKMLLHKWAKLNPVPKHPHGYECELN